MRDIFEEKDRTRMRDEIAAFFKEEHDLELGVIGTIRRWTTRNSFTKDTRIIWRRIIMRCIKTSSRQ